MFGCRPDDGFMGDEAARPAREGREGQRGRRGRGGRGWGDEPPPVRRGEMKFILLSLLAERPKHGYELIKELESRFRRLSPGSVYPTLQMLEEGGYLASEQVNDKRVYTITETGRELLAERNRQPDGGENLPPDRSPELSELRKSVTELNDVVILVARSGNVDHIDRVRNLIDQVKRDIYRTLAN